MKNIIPLALALLSLSATAGTPVFSPPEKRPSKFVLIAISGLKTGREESQSSDIFSNKIGKNMEPSGAWENLPKDHKKILNRAFLSHFSRDTEIQAALALMLDDRGECREDLGLIFMINSWGAITSQKLARAYYEKCQQLPLLSILIEGVSKPTPFSYTKPIWSYNCVNFYQSQSKLKGGSIVNCRNNQFDYKQDGESLFNSHIHAEWDGSERGKKIIEQYMDGKLPVMMNRDLYGIDFEQGLK